MMGGLRSAPASSESLNHSATVNPKLRENHCLLGCQRVSGRDDLEMFGRRRRDGNPDFRAILTPDCRPPAIGLALVCVDNVRLINDRHESCFSARDSSVGCRRAMSIPIHDRWALPGCWRRRAVRVAGIARARAARAGAGHLVNSRTSPGRSLSRAASSGSKRVSNRTAVNPSGTSAKTSKMACSRFAAAAQSCFFGKPPRVPVRSLPRGPGPHRARPRLARPCAGADRPASDHPRLPDSPAGFLESRRGHAPEWFIIFPKG
jgi:hypothetical protein